MSKTNQPAFKLHQINLGDVVVVDVFGFLQRGERYSFKSFSPEPAYVLRIEEVTMNGANSFLITGPLVNYVHGDGTYFTNEEFTRYQEKETERYESMFRSDSNPAATRNFFIDGLHRPNVNLSHVVSRVSVGKGDPHPVTKPIVREFPEFSSTVFNEAVRYFRGRVPFNFDHDYMRYLLRNHALPWWRDVDESDRRVVYNVRKFREAFRRNVNRALMKVPDMEGVSDWADAEYIELDMASSFPDESRAERENEREKIRETYAELAQRWDVFKGGVSRAIRYDRISRPKQDYKNGLSARQVFHQEYNKIRQRAYETEMAEENKRAELGAYCDRDYDCRDYDALARLDDQPQIDQEQVPAPVVYGRRASKTNPELQTPEDDFHPLDD